VPVAVTRRARDADVPVVLDGVNGALARVSVTDGVGVVTQRIG